MVKSMNKVKVKEISGCSDYVKASFVSAYGKTVVTLEKYQIV